MRKKFTSLMLMLMVFVSTAMADLTQNYYLNTNYWQNVDSYPTELDAVIEGAIADNGTAIKKDGATVQMASNTVTVTADGNVVVTFTHSGGQHMLNIMGVDVINAEGTVVESDYHYGSAGGNLINNVYTLEGLTAGSELTLRCFVYDNAGTGDRTNSAQGWYTITNVTGEATVTVKPAVDLASGKYVFREVNGDLVLYNGDKLARGSAFPAVTNNNYIFTITKGDNGFYTIQTVDGKYVTYSATGNSTTLTTSEDADATDENKWWSIREGSSDGLRIIVPSTNDVFGAPGWNYAINLNGAGANTGVGLWNSTGANSNWYIVEAPVLELPDATGGYAKLKIANVQAYSNGTNVVKAADGNNPAFKFTKGDDGHFTIQDANGKYLIYTTTANHLLTLVDETQITDENKWWFVTFDRANRNKALDIFPKQDSYNAGTPAFNWSQNSNSQLGFWNAGDGSSYCTIEFFVTPEVGSFVAFKSAADHAYCNGKYVKTMPIVTNHSGANRDHTQLVFGECDPSVTPSAVFEVIAGATPIDFKLKNVHTQEFVQSFVKNATHMGTEEDAVAITFKPLGEGQIAVYGANNAYPMHAQNDYQVIVTWSGEAGSASAWTIEEVEVFSHTLTIDEYLYMTLQLGYNVTIPEGIEAYAVTGVDTETNELQMEQITGVIPANTAVIVKSTEEIATGETKDYVFTYTAETGTEPAVNYMVGSLYDTYLQPTGTPYVMTLNSNNEIVMGKAKLSLNEAGETGETHIRNRANKAYLDLPGASEVRMFSFGRGEGTTNIESIVNGQQSIVIYDLTGRRVEKMEKGIYIVNGQKIIK